MPTEDQELCLEPSPGSILLHIHVKGTEKGGQRLRGTNQEPGQTPGPHTLSVPYLLGNVFPGLEQVLQQQAMEEYAPFSQRPLGLLVLSAHQFLGSQDSKTPAHSSSLKATQAAISLRLRGGSLEGSDRCFQDDTPASLESVDQQATPPPLAWTVTGAWGTVVSRHWC